ncbi:hypothetical protein PENTCL1PPCAC_26729, partial [Pristionchus entomophagus]
SLSFSSPPSLRQASSSRDARERKGRRRERLTSQMTTTIPRAARNRRREARRHRSLRARDLNPRWNRNPRKPRQPLLPRRNQQGDPRHPRPEESLTPTTPTTRRRVVEVPQVDRQLPSHQPQEEWLEHTTLITRHWPPWEEMRSARIRRSAEAVEADPRPRRAVEWRALMTPTTKRSPLLEEMPLARTRRSEAAEGVGGEGDDDTVPLQTQAAVGGDAFGADKKMVGGGGEPDPRPPQHKELSLALMTPTTKRWLLWVGTRSEQTRRWEEVEEGEEPSLSHLSIRRQ